MLLTTLYPKGGTFNMETETNEKQLEKQLIYNEIPKQVSRKDFNKYIDPHLRKPKKGPKPKITFYKIFNYILYVLHTGIQWNLSGADAPETPNPQDKTQ
jgi:hypothetical protein